jgi:small subunit ribosomal protein S1
MDVDEENRRLSLGHKQLEENPWDVFETVFEINSVQKGTVLTANDKGAVVSLPYGVEGFAPSRHAKKEDNSNVKVDDVLDFKVIEFSKENKKIILSHTFTWKDEKEVKAEAPAKKTASKSKRSAVKKVNESNESTTLGDIAGELSALKSAMEKSEKKK